MNNLFFVHTPLQMVVAQQLIHQENLENNILLYGYIDDNKHFVDIFKLIKISEIWNTSICFNHLPACCDLTHRKPFSCFWSIMQNTKRIDELIMRYRIDNIYLGDISNISYQFLMFYFRGKVKVNIYEEGTSHYGYKNIIFYSRKCQGLQKFILDYCFYLPVFGFRFAKYWFREGDYDNLPVDCRYSIIPEKNQESFDRLLIVDSEFQSEQLKQYLAEEISMVKNCINACFLITSKIYGHQDIQRYKERYSAYLNAIDNYVSSLPQGATVIVKLHPCEGEKEASDIKSIIENKGLNIYFLSKKINVPVELYLQILKIPKIAIFCNSTSMYNGYLYPKCEMRDLICDFFDICKAKKYEVQDLRKLYEQLM